MRPWIYGAAASLSLLMLAGGAQAATLFVGTTSDGVVSGFTTPDLDRGGAVQPYGPAFHGGVRVAVGDVNGDGVADLVTGAGAGGQEVKVFSGGATGPEIRAFNPFDAGYTGGVRVAAGDVNGDGVADIVVGAGTGSHVRVFDGATHDVLHDFNAFDSLLDGGVSVAVGRGDDGRATLVVGAGAGGAPQVKIYDPTTGLLLSSFFAFDPGFTGGVNVAAGITKSGRGVLEFATASGAGRVRVFDGVSFTHDFFAFSPDFTGGVSVAEGSFGGFDSLIVGMQSGGSQVRVFSPDSGRLLSAFNAFDGEGGVNVASSFDAVPEPASWALMLLGFTGLGGALRRRRALVA